MSSPIKHECQRRLYKSSLLHPIKFARKDLTSEVAPADCNQRYFSN